MNPAGKPTELYRRGSSTPSLGFPPDPQDLRIRHIGRVIVNSALDRPGSQYFCCMLAGNRAFCPHTIPSPRSAVLRAILKAADLCGTEPSHAARQLVDDGLTARYDYALQTLNEVPYDRWREYDAEDTSGLLLSPPRGRHGQIDPPEDHRRRHRLALLQRVLTRAQGVSGTTPCAAGRPGHPCRVHKG